MRRVFNLQRDPDSGDLYAIGKSDRPYAFDEVCAFERAAATGDLRAMCSALPGRRRQSEPGCGGGAHVASRQQAHEHVERELGQGCRIRQLLWCHSTR